MDFRTDHLDPQNILADLLAQKDPLELVLAARKGVRTTIPELRAETARNHNINGRELSGEMIVRLIEEARAAREESYAPYSHFNVGAAILARSRSGDEWIFRGSNVENAAYGSTVCAERVGALKAVSTGFREFLAYAVVGDFDQSVSKDIRQAARKEFITPCGACRQVTNEFEANPCAVILALETGQVLITTLNFLLPAAFGPRSLGVEAAAYRRGTAKAHGSG